MNGKDTELRPAAPEDAALAARLIYDTDPHIFDYVYNYDSRVMLDLLAHQWRQERGLFSHALATVSMRDGALIGFESGYDSDQLAEHVPYTRRHLRAKASPELLSHMREAFGYVSYLLPQIPEGAYYIQNLATRSAVRGSGEGEKLLAATFERAAGQGYRSCHLDVYATNPAVRFYRRMGMELLVETRVPILDELHAIPVHYRMVKPLS